MGKRRRSRSTVAAPVRPIRGAWLGASLAALLVLAGYAGTLWHPFVYDDRTTIVNNGSLRSLWDLRAILTHDPKRPLVNLSYAIDWALSGAEPFAYHVTSLLIHLANVLLLHRLALAAFGDRRARGSLPADEDADRRGALVAAALFAAHPMMTESVGYVSGRSGMLATTFSLAALLLLRAGARSRRVVFVAAGLGAWAAGLASKETAAMLPLAFLAYDRLLLPGTSDERRARLVRLHGPLLMILFAGGVARLAVFARLELSRVRPLGEHAWTQLGVVFRYLALLLFPAGQSIAHSVHVATSPFDAVALPSLAALVALAAFAWRVRRRAPEITFGLIWFALFLLPSSAIPLAEPMSEHRVYEPSAGLFLVAGAAWLRLGSFTKRDPGRALPFVLAAALLALTVGRNRVWADPITLWSDGVANAPDLWTAHYALANEYQYANRCRDALPEYQAAIRLKPSQRALVNVGACLAQLGRLDDAVKIFDTALALGPGVDPHFNLGLVEVARGRHAEARAHFREVIALDPKHVAARQALVDLDETVFHDRADALRLCREIAALAPNTPGVAECLKKDAAPE